MKKTLILMVVLGLNISVINAICVDSIVASTPTNQFSIHADGTVTDNKTGLIWMSCSLGQSWDGVTCIGSASGMSWKAALENAQSQAFAGESDWRLPNIKELISIVEQACYSPAINAAIFPATLSSWYWSSSPYAYYSGSTWSVHFNYGYDDESYKVNSQVVRLVRGGQ